MFINNCGSNKEFRVFFSVYRDIHFVTFGKLYAYIHVQVCFSLLYG